MNDQELQIQFQAFEQQIMQLQQQLQTVERAIVELSQLSGDLEELKGILIRKFFHLLEGEFS